MRAGEQGDTVGISKEKVGAWGGGGIVEE